MRLQRIEAKVLRLNILLGLYLLKDLAQDPIPVTFLTKSPVLVKIFPASDPVLITCPGCIKLGSVISGFASKIASTVVLFSVAILFKVSPCSTTVVV